jgi:hypothetical protein
MRTCAVAFGRGCALVHWPEPFPAGGRLRRDFDHHDFHPFRAALRMPMRLAAASERSMIGRFLPVNGPRSLIVTTTCCFVRRFVTFTFVPRGKERCTAVNCCREKRSPLAVLRP